MWEEDEPKHSEMSKPSEEIQGESPAFSSAPDGGNAVQKPSASPYSESV